MKYILGASAALFSAVSAHSWLECTDMDNSQILPWMEANSTMNPPVIVDPGMPWFTGFCSGWPRNKVAGGNWIDESTNYVWNIAAERFNMGAVKPPDTHACQPNQRTPTYLPGAPMKTAAPGDTIRLQFGGNGHTRGFNTGGTVNPNPAGPGTVSVYWKGAPEQEIVDISEFTPANLLQQNGFADESFSYPADPSIKTPTQGLVDKGNWQSLKLPTSMAPGRHMMVWVWTYQDAPQWSTCFDVMIQGSPSSGSGSSAPAAPAAPAAVVNADAAPAPAPASPPPPAAPPAEPAAPATTPAPMPLTDANGEVVETVYTTVDVWTTVWDKKRRHVRQFKN